MTERTHVLILFETKRTRWAIQFIGTACTAIGQDILTAFPSQYVSSAGARTFSDRSGAGSEVAFHRQNNERQGKQRCFTPWEVYAAKRLDHVVAGRYTDETGGDTDREGLRRVAEARAASWFRRGTTTLHVFVSSPGDCVAERLALRDVILRVSTSEEARRAGIELRPLLWEDLPPGQATPGNLQSRVNDLLARYGLDRFEIYLGLMKGRLGTKTASFASGTIEELETAIAEHDRTKLPAEVLFYFLDPASAPEDVLAFRKELENRGFLFGDVASQEELGQRVYHHLTRIVGEWFHLKNRLRRMARSARTAAILAASILAITASVAYVHLDLGGARRVDAALARGPIAAIESYEVEAPYLLVHARSARRKVNEALLQRIREAQPLAARLDLFERWQGSRVARPDTLGVARNELRSEARRALTDLTYVMNNAEAVALWERTMRAGVWPADDKDARRLLYLIAARRLFESLAREGIEPASWAGRCRPFEIDALRAFARNAAQRPGFERWSTREHRLAASVLAEAWPKLGMLASEAIRNDVDVPAEVEAFVRHAPVATVQAWLAANVTRSTGDPYVHQVVLAAEERRDPAILATLVDAMQRSAIDAEVHAGDLLRALTGIDAGAVALDRVRKLLDGDTAVPEPVWTIWLTAAPLEQLTAAERARLVAKLLPLVRRSNATPELTEAAYGALATAGGDDARRFLLARYDEYRSERTSFAFASKAALIDALVILRTPRVADRALALASIARRESESVGASDWNVQAAYLRALAADRSTWPAHADAVRALFTRREHDGESLLPDRFDAAAVELTGKLTGPQMLQLLALPQGIVSDELEGKWGARWYALRAFSEAGVVADPAVVRAVLPHLPIDDELRLSVAGAMARCGGAVARVFFANEYRRDPQRNRPYLRFSARLGDEPLLRDIAAGWTPAAGDELLKAVLEAAEQLPEAGRRRVVETAVGRVDVAHAPALWGDAAATKVAHGVLADAARRELRDPNARNRPAAVLYLAAIGEDWRALDDAPTAAAVAAYLRTAVPFDWMALAQSFSRQAPNVKSVRQLMDARAFLFVHESELTPEAGTFSAGRITISNPLMATYAARGGREAALHLLEVADTPAAVTVLGLAANASAFHRGYALWLAAEGVAGVPLSSIWREHRVVAVLGGNDALLVRAGAAVCIGAAKG